MLRKQDSMFVFEITFLFLIINGAYGTGFWFYSQPRRMNSDFTFPGKVRFFHSISNDDFNSPNNENSFELKAEARLGSEQAPAVGKKVQVENKLVFPESNAKSMASVPICKGSTFCEDVPDYPIDLINRAVLNDKNLKHYENVDVMETISQRIGEPNTEALCASSERIIYPRSAQAIDNNWYFVVNHPDVQQGVRIEVCEGAGKECDTLNLRAGTVSYCGQKYIYRKLMALKNGTIERDDFRFPVSCCCHVEFVGNAMSRFELDDYESDDREPRTV